MLGKTQRSKSEPGAPGVDAGLSSAAMANVLASIGHSVDQLRASNLSGREFRSLAIARRSSEAQAWAGISHAARVRGAR